MASGALAPGLKARRPRRGPRSSSWRERSVTSDGAGTVGAGAEIPIRRRRRLNHCAPTQVISKSDWAGSRPSRAAAALASGSWSSNRTGLQRDLALSPAETRRDTKRAGG